MKLTDTHLVLLSAAAQHEDQLLPRPDHTSDKAVQTLAAKLIRTGLAEAVAVRSPQPHWRRQDDTPVGLRITREGLLALGLDDDAEGMRPLGLDDEAQICPPAPEQHTTRQAAPAPRAGSKQAAVLDLLGREQGATLDDLIRATGWLAHTTRAALTRLRQRGHLLDRSKGEDGRAVYRLRKASDASVPVSVEG